MRARGWTCGIVAVVVAVGCMALPTPAGADPSPLDSLTLDFIVDQSGLVVIDGAANRDTYDQAPTPPERAAIAGQVVDALSIPGDTAQVDPEKSDLYHEVGFRISLHQAFANDGDDGVRIDTGVLQPIAAAFGTLTLDVCRVVAPGLTLSIDASAPSTSPDPSGAGAPQTDRVDCRTWVMRPEDPPVVVTAHVSSTPAPAPAPEPRATARVVLPCGTPTTGDPTFVDAELITYPAHVLQAHATGLSSSHLLEADTVLGVHDPNSGRPRRPEGGDRAPLVRSSRRTARDAAPDHAGVQVRTGASVDVGGHQDLGGSGWVRAGNRDDAKCEAHRPLPGGRALLTTRIACAVALVLAATMLPAGADTTGVTATAALDCADPIGFTAPPRSEVVGGQVALLTSASRHRAAQAASFGDPATAQYRYFSKSPLYVRTGTGSAQIVIPRSERGRVAVSWGNTDHDGTATSTFDVGPCAGTRRWIVFPGGYFVTEPHCVKLSERGGQHATDRARGCRQGVSGSATASTGSIAVRTRAVCGIGSVRGMSIQHFSHMAIGVRDMDVALPFWRDVVGLRVSLDTVESMPRGDGNPPARRRAVYMRWDDDPRSSFVVLDQQLDFDTPGEPAQIFQMGLHHYGFWVDDVDPILARVEAAGVKVLLNGSVGADSVWWGEPPGDTIRSIIVQDPEGGYVQFDQRV